MFYLQKIDVLAEFQQREKSSKEKINLVVIGMYVCKFATTKLASYPGPYTRAVCASFQRRNKGLVSTVLRMCQFKTNEYTQTMLLGVELLCVTFYV